MRTIFVTAAGSRYRKAKEQKSDLDCAQRVGRAARLERGDLVVFRHCFASRFTTAWPGFHGPSTHLVSTLHNACKKSW